MTEESGLGKKRVLRLSVSASEVEFFKSTAVSDGVVPQMDAVLKDHFVSDSDNGNFTITFRTRIINKEALAIRVEELARYYQTAGLRKKKKILKQEALEAMLPTAPIRSSITLVTVDPDAVYIFGSHKKVAETFFGASLGVTPRFEDITKLWESSGKPCKNVTIFHEAFEYTRVFKDDADKLATESVEGGGAVQKFSDVFSYSMVLGRLMVSGEFVDICSIDAVYLQAEEALNEG